MGYFSKLGIIGWDRIEPIILGAILSNKSVLLKGAHGSNKTEGCKVISEAVFGEGTKFVPYDTSLVNADDLLGFLHPGKLAQGKMEFISTPDSIWDATSCLLDEINRCNPYNAAKFFEIVRSRTINGRKTALEFVWAACNPPDKYNTAHMDAAQVSRFVVLTVPTFSDLSVAQRRKLMGLNGDRTVGSLKPLIDAARKAKVSKAQAKSIDEKTMKLSTTLNNKGVEFSGRQVRDLHALLMNMDRVSSTFEDLPEISEESLTDAIMGLVPESTGLIRTTADATALRAEVVTIIKGFKLSDPILTASTVAELAKAQGKDMQGWAGVLTDMVMIEEDPKAVAAGWEEITKRKDITPAIFDALRQSFAAKDAILTMTNKGKDTPTVDAANVLAVSLKTFGPRSTTKKRKNKNKK
jgi:MoxR-like ATPase